MTATSHPRKTRAATGCLTCRIRKVKCDEAKPSCTKCISTGRTCDGYSTLPFSRTDLRAASAEQGYLPRLTGLVSVLLSDKSFEDTVERRYLQFFRTCTVPSTTSTVCHDAETHYFAVMVGLTRKCRLTLAFGLALYFKLLTQSAQYATPYSLLERCTTAC